ncbi:MAG: hypothetical protein DUD35_05510 [Lactobacillus sp.]|jgi:hypothetical protein|uniref:hypothetical protein n=1 Tax=Lentilactobacillus hilgardii TaxID=1588 RepID=UPI000FEDACD7|nr:MAG: hypothetical protein DUD35_05510 [Lactobacillus sp.]
MTNKVNWEIFDIDPWDDSQDVSRSQTVHEFKKYDGTPAEFANELAKRFEWSGEMCLIVEGWLKDVRAGK